MLIGMLRIYRLLFVFSVCLSAGYWITDILGVGRRRAMKFCRVVDLGVHQVFSPLNFGPRVSPPRAKREKLIMHWMVISQVRQTVWAVTRPVLQTSHHWR